MLSSLLASVLVFAAVVLGVQALAGVFLGRMDQSRRVSRRLEVFETGVVRAEGDQDQLFRRGATGGQGGAMGGLQDRVSLFLEQADITMHPLQLLLFAAGGAGVLWFGSLTLMLSRGVGNVVLNGGASLVGALALSGAALWLWMSGRRARRIKKIEEQLPLALDVVNRAIRAGHPMVSAIQLAATELGEPLAGQFRIMVDETAYGSDFKEALANFARRTGSRDAHFFAVSVSIQSETGGSLAEILEGLASVIRARATLGKRIKALASEGRASAAVLSALPVLLIGTLVMLQPSYYTDKFSDPVFWPVITAVFIVFIIGQVIMKRIVNFKY